MLVESDVHATGVENRIHSAQRYGTAVLVATFNAIKGSHLCIAPQQALVRSLQHSKPFACGSGAAWRAMVLIPEDIASPPSYECKNVLINRLNLQGIATGLDVLPALHRACCSKTITPRVFLSFSASKSYAGHCRGTERLASAACCRLNGHACSARHLPQMPHDLLS